MDYKIITIHGYSAGTTAEVLVDADDYEFLSQWSWKQSGPNGYARRTIRKRGGGFTTLYMHRLIVGKIPDTMVVDHINGNPLDNRKFNLRICTQSENEINRHVSTGVCQVNGVCKHYDRYQARITRNKKRIYLGRFKTIDEAEKAIQDYDTQNNHYHQIA